MFNFRWLWPVFFLVGCASPIRKTHSVNHIPSEKTIERTSEKKPISNSSMQTGSPRGVQQPQQTKTTPLPNDDFNYSQLVKAGSFLEAFNLSSALALSTGDPAKIENYKQKSIELINEKLTSEELHHVSRTSDYGYFRSYSLFRLGNKELQVNPEESKKFYHSVIELMPDGELAEKSKTILNDMEISRRVSPQTIGVVLPLTGKNAAIGQRLLRGVQLGLGTHQSFSKFKIAIVDSEGRADTARIGVERLIKEDNVIAIIGGALNKTVQSELIVANEFNVPFIYLSQKQGINEIHPTSIRNSLTPEMQVRQIVRTAMLDLNMKNFAILYPNDPYGIEYTNAFWDEVLAQGGHIVSAQTYNPKENDFRPMVQRLVGTYYIEARKEEYLQKLKLFKQNLKTKNSRENVNVDDILPAIQDFDAIFIPDQARVIAQIGAFLSYSGIKDTTILSTNLLNIPGISKKFINFNFPVLFVDSFISDGPNQIASDFAKDYESIFNEKPSQIEISAYDSGLILRQLILKGSDTREDLGLKLTQLKSFPASYGQLNVTSTKEVLKPLITLTLKKGEVSIFKN